MNIAGKYDYIFAGTGCASLSLVMRMIKSGHFANSRILLIDRERKAKNDRTWCFWETEAGFFEDIVFRKWQLLDFYGRGFHRSLDIHPYQYKMIRGVDFYQYCLDEINQHRNIELVQGDLGSVSSTINATTLVIDGQSIDLPPAVVFNSIPSTPDPSVAVRLLQHFKGWVIDFDTAVFDKDKACLMDFRVTQKHGTAFVYVLPSSEKRALVEFTLLTKGLLSPGDYDNELKNYISQFISGQPYRIIEEEFGVIPMTTEQLPFYKNGIYHLGAAGGQTKASSGYTFQFIQKHSQEIVDRLVSRDRLQDLPETPGRFRFYDNTLLRILHHDMLPGSLVFSELFKKNKPQDVLRFLDNESSLSAELRIISSLPKWPFMKAALGIR